MRALGTSWGRRPDTSARGSRIWPRLGLIDPSMVRSGVVFAAPLAPRIAVIVPAAAVSDTPRSTGAPPYPEATPATTSDAGSGARAESVMEHAQVRLGDQRIGLHLRRVSLRDQHAEV